MGDDKNVKTNNGFFTKQLVSARLSVDTVELIDENFELITGGPVTVTDRKLIECLLDLALSKAKPDSKIQKRIEDLIGQVDTLTIANDQLTKANDMLLGNNDELQREISILPNQARVSELISENEALIGEKNLLTIAKSKLEGDLVASRENNAIPEGAVIVVMAIKEKTVLEHCAKEETERTGTEVTPGLLLKNVFAHVLINGPHDMFKAPVSIQKIRELMGNIS